MKQDLQLASYTAFIKKTRVHVEIHPPHVSYQVIDQKSNEVIASYQHKRAASKLLHSRKVSILMQRDIQAAVDLSLSNLAVNRIN